MSILKPKPNQLLTNKTTQTTANQNQNCNNHLITFNTHLKSALYIYFVMDQMQSLAIWFWFHQGHKAVFSLPLINKSELAIQTVSGDKLHHWGILHQVTALRHTCWLKFSNSY